MNIYTDGSHVKNKVNGHLGYGAYCIFNNVEYGLSKTITTDTLSKYGIKEQNVSNPTAEFLAFVEVLDKLKGVGFHKLTFHIDYIGVGNWMSGKWKAKKPYIKKLKDYSNDIIEKYNLDIMIKHVKGHSNDIGNDKADFYAKQKQNIDEF